MDEPSPNFIVVYDLQSGTLFKKWKPGVNTVSLDISSRDSCVISGLEDSRILVWDLITGMYMKAPYKVSRLIDSDIIKDFHISQA